MGFGEFGMGWIKYYQRELCKKNSRLGGWRVMDRYGRKGPIGKKTAKIRHIGS